MGEAHLGFSGMNIYINPGRVHVDHHYSHGLLVRGNQSAIRLLYRVSDIAIAHGPTVDK